MTMPADRPDGDGAGGLDEIVKGALADALAGSEASPARLDTPPDTPPHAPPFAPRYAPLFAPHYAPLFAPRYAPLDPLAMVPFDLFGVAERGDWNLLPALMFPAPASVRGGPSGVPTPGLPRDFPALDQGVHARAPRLLGHAAA